MLLNCGVGEDSRESLGLQGDTTSPPKGNQSWIFLGRTDAEADTPILWATWCEELSHLKRPWCWERLKAGGEGDDRGWDVWMASPTRWTLVWARSRSWWWIGKPGMLQSMGLQSRTQLSDWTELNHLQTLRFSRYGYNPGSDSGDCDAGGLLIMLLKTQC